LLWFIMWICVLCCFLDNLYNISAYWCCLDWSHMIHVFAYSTILLIGLWFEIACFLTLGLSVWKWLCSFDVACILFWSNYSGTKGVIAFCYSCFRGHSFLGGRRGTFWGIRSEHHSSGLWLSILSSRCPYILYLLPSSF